MRPFERLQKYNTKGNLWIYILHLLQKEPIHAWRLQPLIEKRFGFKPGRITAYRVLYRLEKEGFVKSKLKDRRRIYKITREGTKELKQAKEFYRGILTQLR